MIEDFLNTNSFNDSTAHHQLNIWAFPEYPDHVRAYPQLRYMGSKYRLLPWIHQILAQLEFRSALDAFSGSGCVAYLMKAMDKQVISNDFLNFAYHIALATIENSCDKISPEKLETLLKSNANRDDFIERTFSGIFFTPMDLRFLDNIWSNLPELPNPYHRALVIAAIIRACVKRQPRGVFTIAGDPDHYKDGRRDLKLTLQEHFVESIKIYNDIVFDNQKK